MQDSVIPSTYFRTHLWLMRIGGVSLNANKDNLKYRVYSTAVLLFGGYTHSILGIVELPNLVHDLDNLADGITYIISIALGAFKVGALMYYRTDVINILMDLENGVFVPDERRGGPIEYRLVNNARKIIRFQTLIYLGTSAVSIIDGVILSIYVRVTQTVDLWRLPLNITGIFNKPGYFEFGVIYQAVSVGLAILSFFSADLLISGILIHIGVQFKILQNYIRLAGEKAKQLHNNPNEEIPRTTLYSIANDIIEYHVKITRISAQVEKVYNKIVLPVFVADALCLCFCLYRFTMLNVFGFAFLQNLVAYLYLLCQVFMFCYWGENATYESLQVSNAVMESDWVGKDILYQKMMLRILHRGQKPTIFTAGKFINLSLATFVSIMKASYSFFTLVNRVQKQ